MADRSSLALTVGQPPGIKVRSRLLGGLASPAAEPALEFVSTVAHELRQSLTVLSASVAILQPAASEAARTGHRQVEARSEGSGQGSEFIVTLPFAAPPPATPICGPT